MRSIISTFLGACQDPTTSLRQLFCNYLHSEIEHLEERDFLTFSNETVKLLSEIQYKAEEHKRQVTTFQLPEATQATAGCEYILTILETQAVSIPVVQPTQIAITRLPVASWSWWLTSWDGGDSFFNQIKNAGSILVKFL